VTSSRTESTLVDVTMPQMGVSVAEGTIVGWRVEVGDRIDADQPICDISTDKIDTEVPAPVEGVVAEILVAVDETVAVGTVLARIAAGSGSAASSAPVPAPADPAPAAPAGSAPAPAPADPAPADPTPTADAPAGPAPGAPAPVSDAPEPGAGNGARNGAAGTAPATGDLRRYSPVVQRIAAEHGIDLSQVQGTGRGGRVRKQDLLAFVNDGGAAAPTPAVQEPPLHIESPYRPDPIPAAPAASAGSGQLSPAPAASAGSGQLSRMRRQIGEHMKRSLETAAHCTTWIEVDMSRVEEARKRLGVTGLAFVSRAVIDALREHPALNATLEDEEYAVHRDVNLGIAVSLGDDGLIVPVIHSAHELSVEGLAARVKDLARRARSRELKPDEVRGGTFTITNPGQYGSIMATPIINQPQVAILDFEAVIKRPVVVTDADGNDSIAIRPITILGLSWDHRALDGALSAQFLATVKRRLEGAVSR
jgi:2-oxoglutarate dehydrogenase E2 component (dihydrolipoamide succinyltransferase)